jgi:hypothetical protein
MDESGDGWLRGYGSASAFMGCTRAINGMGTQPIPNPPIRIPLRGYLAGVSGPQKQSHTAPAENSGFRPLKSQVGASPYGYPNWGSRHQSAGAPLRNPVPAKPGRDPLLPPGYHNQARDHGTTPRVLPGGQIQN